VILAFALQSRQRFLALPENAFFPFQQFAPEIILLALVHERLFFRRPIPVLDHLSHAHAGESPLGFGALIASSSLHHNDNTELSDKSGAPAPISRQLATFGGKRQFAKALPASADERPALSRVSP
jgi:hypothetical protein